MCKTHLLRLDNPVVFIRFRTSQRCKNTKKLNTTIKYRITTFHINWSEHYSVLENNCTFALSKFILLNIKRRFIVEYTVIIQKCPKSGWYVGQCMQLPAALSQGATLDELMSNMKEAIELIIESNKEDMRENYRNQKVFYRKITVNI